MPYKPKLRSLRPHFLVLILLVSSNDGLSWCNVVKPVLWTHYRSWQRFLDRPDKSHIDFTHLHPVFHNHTLPLAAEILKLISHCSPNVTYLCLGRPITWRVLNVNHLPVWRQPRGHVGPDQNYLEVTVKTIRAWMIEQSSKYSDD